MIHYELNEHTYYDTEYGEYVSYGVTVFRDNTILRKFGDVSVDKAGAEALVKLFNEERLSPAQLDEAIEDYLMDFSIDI